MIKTLINLDTLVTQADDVISAEIEDEIVMLRLESDAYYHTDDIGAEIWRRIAEPTTVRALCEQLLELYEVEPETCQADVLAFLQEAHSEGTVRIVPPEGLGH